MFAGVRSDHTRWLQQLTVYVMMAIWLQGCSPRQFLHAKPVADRFIQLLSSGQYTRAEGMIDPKKQSAYQSPYLAQRWTQLEQAVGKPYAILLTGMYATVSIDLSGGAGNNTGRGLRYAYKVRGPKGSCEVDVWLRHDGKRWRVWDVSILC